MINKKDFMTIVKYKDKKWKIIDRENVDESIDELTDLEIQDFIQFDVMQFKEPGFELEPFVNCKLAESVINLLTSKYASNTFCVIDNLLGCGIWSEVYWRLMDEHNRNLAYWHFRELEKNIKKDEKCLIYPFQIFSEFKNREIIFTERYLCDLLTVKFKK